MYNKLNRKGIVVFTKKGVTLHSKTEGKILVRINVPTSISKELYQREGPIIIAIFDNNYSLDDVLSLLGEKNISCTSCNQLMDRKIVFVCGNSLCKTNPTGDVKRRSLNVI